jgi:hypothetical protein
MLHTVKLSNSKVGDFGVQNLFKAAPNIEHLELAVLEFADYGLKAIL